MVYANVWNENIIYILYYIIVYLNDFEIMFFGFFFSFIFIFVLNICFTNIGVFLYLRIDLIKFHNDIQFYCCVFFLDFIWYIYIYFLFYLILYDIYFKSRKYFCLEIGFKIYFIFCNIKNIFGKYDFYCRTNTIMVTNLEHIHI